MQTDANPYDTSKVTADVDSISAPPITPVRKLRLLTSVCASSLLGGLAQGLITATLYALLDLGADTLPISALCGLAIGSLLALSTWASFQLEALRRLSLRNGMAMSAVLIISVPAAACVAIELFQAMNAAVPPLTDEVDMALAIGSSGMVFFAINLTALQVAFIALSSSTPQQPSS